MYVIKTFESTNSGHVLNNINTKLTSLFGLRCPPHAIFKLKSDIKNTFICIFYAHMLVTMQKIANVIGQK